MEAQMKRNYVAVGIAVGIVVAAAVIVLAIRLQQQEQLKTQVLPEPDSLYGEKLTISIPQDNAVMPTSFTAVGAVRPRNSTVTGTARTAGPPPAVVQGVNSSVDPATGHWTMDFRNLPPGRWNLEVRADTGGRDSVFFQVR